MFLVEARKKLKQKEVGCSIWQSMQSRRLLQQWWNHKKRYKNSFSRMRFSRMFIYLQKAFAFICSFLFTYINGTSSCKQLVDLNTVSYSNCLMKKRPKFRNSLDTGNMISLLCFARVLDFLALSRLFWRGVKCWFGSIYEIWIRTGRPNHVKFK